MKRLFAAAVCAAAIAAVADETIELAEVGVTEVVSDLRNTLVAVSYADLAREGGMVPENLIKTTALSEGDILAVLNGEAYCTWRLDRADSGALLWTKDAKKMVVDATGALLATDDDAAGDALVPVGAGIWLVRRDEPAEPFTFQLYGRPSDDASTTAAAGKSTLVGNPRMVPLAPTVAGMQVGDRIVIPTKGVPMTYTYTTTRNGGEAAWRYQKFDGTAGTGLPEVPAGRGFWYQAVADGAGRTISWEDR